MVGLKPLMECCLCMLGDYGYHGVGFGGRKVGAGGGCVGVGVGVMACCLSVVLRIESCGVRDRLSKLITQV